jgi:RimJ/RimL family protein N-acetyltransferase
MPASTQPGQVLAEGRLVRLTRFDPSNITATYLAWLNDRALMRYSNQRFRVHSVESCRNYVASFDGTDNLFLAIHHDGVMVGTMTAYVSAAHGSADLGLLIGAQGQGKGLGLDAWSSLMQYLLDHGIRKVSGGTLRCNTAMVKIMERSGMAPDGVRVAHELVDGTAQDILHFAKFGA